MMTRQTLSMLLAALLLLGLTACEDTTLLREGSTMKSAKKYEEAIEKFETFLRQNPDTKLAPKIRREIADAYYRMGEQNASIKKFEPAIEAMETIIRDFRDSPRRPDATFRVPTYYIGLADKLLRDDKYIEASKSLARVVERYPGSVASKDAAQRLQQVGIITFVSGGDIWAANADGTNPRKLVENAIDPDLAPDGKRLAFIQVEKKGDSKGVIKTLDLAAENAESVVRSKSPTAYRPRWSPDGDEIVLTKSRYQTDLDGRRRLRKLFQILPIDIPGDVKNQWGVQGLDTIGDYKPNGQSFIGFEQRKIGGKYRLTEVNRKFEGVILAEFEDAPVRTATYTPDGRMVVFARSDGLYLINPNGEELRPLLKSDEHGNLDIQFLDTSPSGRHIVLLAKSESDPDLRIYTISLRREIQQIPIMVEREVPEGEEAPAEPEMVEIFPDAGTVSWEQGWL